MEVSSCSMMTSLPVMVSPLSADAKTLDVSYGLANTTRVDRESRHLERLTSCHLLRLHAPGFPPLQADLLGGT